MPMVWVPFLWNAFAMEWIGMQCIEIHSIPMDSKRPRNSVGDRLGKGVRGFSRQCRQSSQQDYYCRHHIIRAAVAAGVITEVRAGAGTIAVNPIG